MDHSRFVQSLRDAGFVFRRDGLFYFVDEIIERWLQDNKWVEDPSAPCQWCKHLEKIGYGVRSGSAFSESQCHRNVEAGGSCYREELRTIFIPFLRNALKGIYPPVEDLMIPTHKRGPVSDGIGEFTLLGMICHELGPYTYSGEMSLKEVTWIVTK